MALVKTLGWASEEEESVIGCPRPRVVRPRSSSSSVVHRCCRWTSAVLVASSSPSPSSLERDSQLAVAGDDDVFVRCPCQASSCCPRRGAAWLLLCRHATRQCGWAFEEAATHLCRVVGAPPTWLGPSPLSSIAVVQFVVAVIRTAWPMGQSQRGRRRQSSVVIVVIIRCRCGGVADSDGGRRAWPSR